MLVKSLYGILRDEGYNVDMADHPAAAVQAIMKDGYEAVIMDSGSFGLSAEDASQIISTVCPEIRIILVGCAENEADTSAIRVPADLQVLRDLINTDNRRTSLR